ncbi:MAG: hypothetical protein AAB930_01700 [Patescibacteria group bacterium]
MDLSKIKNLVKKNGDKFIFVENGEPEVVMMSFHEYEKLTNGGNIEKRPYVQGAGAPRQFEFSDHNEDAFLETEFVESSVRETAGLPLRLENVRLEDLPI